MKVLGVSMELRIPIFFVSLFLPGMCVHGEEVVLFDGKTFAGWTTTDGEPVIRGWEVADGMIHFAPGESRAGHIMTTRQFQNFVLDFEWKIAPGGNSGVKYRVHKFSGHMSGLEYQIIDDDGYAHPLPPKGTTGALYNLVAPNEEKQLNPPGQFNSSRIVVQDNNIQHWLNGKLIVSATVGDAEWNKRVDESKFDDNKNIGRNRVGKIMLTDHHSEVWYRNLKLTTLPENQTVAPAGVE